ncbi:hypothetical protein [Kribbella sp. NPDC051770]|uniref:hypothetical protein n=1 Tax=Kribbella sp. NPDC051770 TaxID=3155413 RepID=UPI00341F82C9
MKVRFVGVKDYPQHVRQGANGFHEGQVWPVLEAYFSVDGPNQLRIETIEGEGPGLYDSRLFEIVDPTLSSVWCCSIDADGSLTFAPEAWLVPGFWEQFFDQVPDAIDTFEIGRRAVLADSE